ncbi:GNAT family N-acetyltransferase [Noviherbaspirillum sp.]|jgi:hypothetical protein|uniref:GNAT family N-acetyltransferase n=1 Tax=Noviherbaspirillum sp. TaxID=1926288 RepID=UPI0025E2ABC6|nr:GNAT family N-acetyltransferase [Noviherbaspirillum sp.]
MTPFDIEPNFAAEADIVVHENEVPPHVGPELDRLYGTLYSSLTYFHACASLAGVSTYIARRNRVPTAVFLYRREGTRLYVVNEGMRLEAAEVERFAHHMFAGSDPVDMIILHAVQMESRGVPLLQQRFFCAEDFIVTLPSTPQDYLARLGSSTRKNLKRHRNRVERDFPSFRHCIVERGDVDERLIREIIELSRARIAGKGISFGIDEDETRNIIKLVQRSGAVLLATIDGRLCGGTIMYRIGKNWISRVNAHDPAYDDYRLGMLCCYLAICNAIESGAEHFHLGHSWYEYKTALLGELQAFDHITLYRSRGALLRHAGTATRTACKGYALQANRWIVHRAATDKRFHWRVVGKMLAAWRAAKSQRASALRVP